LTGTDRNASIPVRIVAGVTCREDTTSIAKTQ
jgi:hypothetical protein